MSNVHKQLVIYLMAGRETPELVEAAVAGGADIVEIGFPFSDPLVGRGRRDELDPLHLGPLARGKVGDDQPGRPGGARVGHESLPAVGLEQRGVRHRHERRVSHA